ncbi:phage head closure protein [Paenibacillus wenxiniae]|uniref:Phage head closure protein n=1 Tax=Paenibacillus wenxiniae TaxID=1636843 RepID=A0ABW4RHE4_9BACL
MNYDHELTLLEYPIIEDEIGNQIPGEPVETALLCRQQSVSRSEFYNAAAAGLQPEILFTIHAYEYDGQRELLFEGSKYKVIRTYQASFEELELTCQKVVST